ncbi:putative transcriptional regulator YdeE [Paenibacillus sp. BK720]|nr:putative transcriptional regulator YdeE [Paenibacillus sp. BK720]
MEQIPEGMTSVTVPALTYAKTEHKKGDNIDSSYTNIFAWIGKQGYPLHRGDVTHFELYPMAQDPYAKDPEFTIMIPVDSKA